VVAKAFERVVLRRLWSAVGSRISADQAGFRKFGATTDQIYRVVAAVHGAWAVDEPLPVAFLDISKAFDRVWHDGLLFKLHDIGIRGRAWRWLRAFLSDRRLRVAHNGAFSKWVPLHAGTPQGSVISPFLFLVFINDLNLEPCDAALFADDIAILPIASTDLYPTRESRLRPALRSADAWARRWLVTFNAIKSGIVVFTDEKNAAAAEMDPPLTIGDRPIPVVDHYRYLGVVLHRSLDWALHTADVLRRATTASNLIRRLITPRTPHPRTVLTLVRTALLPVITYAWPLWRPSAAGFTKLRSVVAAPLARVLALGKTPSFDALFVEYGLPRLTDLFHRFALAFAHRALHLPAVHRVRALFGLDLAAATHRRSRADQGLRPAPLKRGDAVVPVVVGEHVLDAEVALVSPAVTAGDFKAGDLPQLALAASFDAWQSPPAAGAEHKARKSFIHRLRIAPGLAAYLRFDSRPFAMLRARLRLNRSRLRDSEFRRQVPGVTSPACEHCAALPRAAGAAPPADTPKHLLRECPMPALVAARAKHKANWQYATMLGHPNANLPPKVVAELVATTAAFLADVLAARGGFL
jgi:hypothetical protein